MLLNENEFLISVHRKDIIKWIYASTDNAVYWNITPCDSCKNTRFAEMYRLHYQGDKNR
jgi:hypothetical protein